MAKNPHVLYPVRFGPKNTLASSVDYAYYMFFAVSAMFLLNSVSISRCFRILVSLKRRITR